jgi:hypothetical protein
MRGIGGKVDIESEIPTVTERDWTALYKHIRERNAVHAESAIRRNKRYKRMAAWLHTFIPLTSLALTVLATSEFPRQHAVTAAVAILLTVLTGLNYTLEPARRYSAYSSICVSLHDSLFELESGVERLRNSPPEEVLQLLDKINADLSAIGRVMAGLPVAREHLG